MWCKHSVNLHPFWKIKILLCSERGWREGILIEDVHTNKLIVVHALHMQVVAEEELLKADSKGDNQEAELLILDEFAVLCRDLYAFYPILIRYVDNNRCKIYTRYFLTISKMLFSGF